MNTIFMTWILTTALLMVNPAGEVKQPRPSKVAQEAIELTGTVVDQSTGEALPGALIRIEGTDDSVYTDLDGNFEVKQIQPGTYDLIITLVSYRDNTIDNLSVGKTGKQALKIELTR